jgi:DMSO reductase anchor subunit
MELQWPLILFTSLTAWACGVFGGTGVLALHGAGRKSQMPLTVASVVLLAVGGICVFFHLQHWERIFNGFGHITSGITQELIAIVVFVVVALVYFLKLRKSGEGEVPKALAWCAIAISVVLAAVCAHSYMMAAKPAWNNVLEVASIVGAACLMGPATCAVVMAVRGDDTVPAGLPAVAGSVIGAVCTLAYAVYLQVCGGSGSGFIDVGNYFDPTHPVKAMVDVAATASSQAPLIWAGAVVVGALVPLACCVWARKRGDAAAWKIFGAVAVVAALAGSIFLRMAFYSLGLSVFALY